jgi:hypothetical protein
MTNYQLAVVWQSILLYRSTRGKGGPPLRATAFGASYSVENSGKVKIEMRKTLREDIESSPIPSTVDKFWEA